MLAVLSAASTSIFVGYMFDRNIFGAALVLAFNAFGGYASVALKTRFSPKFRNLQMPFLDAYIRSVTAFCAYELLYVFIFFLVAGAVTVGIGYLLVPNAVEMLGAAAGLIAAYHVGTFGRLRYLAIGIAAVGSVVVCFNAFTA